MIDEENMDRDTARALYRALDLTNLGVIAPHKEKYYLRYDINWLINAVKDGTPLTYVTFWHEGEKYKNNVFSQWYKGNPFVVNGRTYVTAEQYMMSEKALADAEAQSMTTIRDALRECVPEEESQLDIIRVERIADRHYRVFFVSDNRSPDGGDFPQFAKLAREQFPWWRLQMRHIKNIDGSFVTREEYHAKHR